MMGKCKTLRHCRMLYYNYILFWGNRKYVLSLTNNVTYAVSRNSPPETDCVVLLYQMMANDCSAKIERLDIPRVSSEVLNKYYTVTFK